MAKTQEFLYAVVGAGDFAIDKARNLRSIDRKSATNVYTDFVKRGQSLSKKIRNSAPSKQAVAQTKTARTQVKAATTSVSKAVKANTKAVRSAAEKVVKAS